MVVDLASLFQMLDKTGPVLLIFLLLLGFIKGKIIMGWQYDRMKEEAVYWKELAVRATYGGPEMHEETRQVIEARPVERKPKEFDTSEEILCTQCYGGTVYFNGKWQCLVCSQTAVKGEVNDSSAQPLEQ